MTRRKLLIATDNFLPRHDGIARFLSEVLPVLKELFDVTVVAPDFGPVTIDGVRIEQLPLSKRTIGDYKLPKFCFGRVKTLVKEHDIVFAQTLGPIGYAGVRAAKSQKKRLIMFTHSIDWELVPRAVKHPLLARFLPNLVKAFVCRQYRACDALIVPSEMVSETLSWNKVDTKRYVVHLGVDTKVFSPPKDKKVAKELLGIPPDALVVGYHGRLAREKDLKTLLRGFLRVGKGTLLVVGDGLPEIKRMFERKDVILAGPQKNVVPYLQAMDVYCHTSLTETTCLSVLEAMSCGLPVISTPAGYVGDYIEHGKNGLLIPKQNPYALAKVLEPLLKDEGQRRKLGLVARATITKDFTWDKTRAEIKKIFEGL